MSHSFRGSLSLKIQLRILKLKIRTDAFNKKRFIKKKRPDNYFMLCVLAVISPGASLGLYAMYCSYKVHSLYNKRLYNEANKMSARTKLMATISLAIGLFLYMAFSMTVMAITIVKFSK